MSTKYDYNEREKDNGGGFTLGLFVGTLAGALAAVLFAPKPGYETRQQLKDVADQQKENLKNQWEQTKLKASEAVTAAREKVGSVAEQTIGVVDTYADKGKDTIDKLADETKATTERVTKAAVRGRHS